MPDNFVHLPPPFVIVRLPLIAISEAGGARRKTMAGILAGAVACLAAARAASRPMAGVF